MGIRIIDLFAGIGGIRLGVEQAGRELDLEIENVFSSEIDKYARKTYTANFGEEPAGNITQIAAENIPDHDLLCAGFPCQSFSVAGRRFGFEDTRGTLFFDIARILNAKRPRAFLLENVKGLLSHDHGNTLRIIIETIEQLGYSAKYKILSAKDYGVPQNRQRIYIVGFANKGDADLFSFPKPTKRKTQVGEILENLTGKELEKYLISMKVWTSHQERKMKNEAAGKGFGFQLFTSSSEYTATLLARYYKDGSEILIKVPQKCRPRRLTPRECARLQGFPDDFKIVVSDTQAYKQFGNSVSVPVIKAIAKMIFLSLDWTDRKF
jgi:DNA (cytosine-5)-methyltransferase 1